MHCKHENLSLWYGTPDAPAPSETVLAGTEIPFTVGVEPADASNQVEVLYRVNGGPQQTVAARWQRNASAGKIQYFEARLGPFQAGDVVECAAICVCAGRTVPSTADVKRASTSFRVIETGTEERRGGSPQAT
ncbi:MAG: hypothetical protein L0287_18135, partial [Anaerolineae bacterium]|nr:hypothetical protein [Anaerolineae bacterium]